MYLEIVTPEAAFNLKGTIEEAVEAGEKMLAEA